MEGKLLLFFPQWLHVNSAVCLGRVLIAPVGESVDSLCVLLTSEEMLVSDCPDAWEFEVVVVEVSAEEVGLLLSSISSCSRTLLDDILVLDGLEPKLIHHIRGDIVPPEEARDLQAVREVPALVRHNIHVAAARGPVAI